MAEGGSVDYLHEMLMGQGGRFSEPRPPVEVHIASVWVHRWQA